MWLQLELWPSKVDLDEYHLHTLEHIFYIFSHLKLDILTITSHHIYIIELFWKTAPICLLDLLLKLYWFSPGLSSRYPASLTQHSLPVSQLTWARYFITTHLNIYLTSIFCSNHRFLLTFLKGLLVCLAAKIWNNLPSVSDFLIQYFPNL